MLTGWGETETDLLRFNLGHEKDLDKRSHIKDCEVRINLRNGQE